MPKAAIADCLNRHQKLSINNYKDHIKEASKLGTISYFDFSYNYRGKPYSYKLHITTTPCHYGGVRYWWQCPKCDKRVGVLYCAGLYVCRHCLGLSYYSQLQHTYQRPDNRIESIRKRLNWHENPYQRPKGMHHKTYERLFNEYHDIEDYYMSCLTRFDGVTSVKRMKQR